MITNRAPRREISCFSSRGSILTIVGIVLQLVRTLSRYQFWGDKQRRHQKEGSLLVDRASVELSTRPLRRRRRLPSVWRYTSRLRSPASYAVSYILHFFLRRMPSKPDEYIIDTRALQCCSIVDVIFKRTRGKQLSNELIITSNPNHFMIRLHSFRRFSPVIALCNYLFGVPVHTYHLVYRKPIENILR
jgi:hypothetical protein